MYIDFVYQSADGILTVDQAVVKFITELAPRVGEVVLFGRLSETGPAAPYMVPAEGVRFVALPHYESVADVRALIGSFRGAGRAFAETLDTLDAVWLFGPHPLAIVFARIAKSRGVPVLLGVRQDFPRYIAGRVSRVNRIWAMPIAWAHELTYRAMARKTPAVVVGDQLALNYRAARRPHVRPVGVSLISAADIVEPGHPLSHDWDEGPLRILSVGRLDPEKNPLLLIDVITALHARDPRWRLDVVGDGPLADDVAARAHRAGIADQVELHGHVTNGSQLHSLYRQAHALLHVSYTEGLPQVLFEAAAAGLPIVATDVGGVRGALRGGDAGLLIPPADCEAAVRELERVRDDAPLRAALTRNALEIAREGTIERSHDKILDLIETHVTGTTRLSD